MGTLTCTFSIVARDERTGQFGGGVASRAFPSGAVVPWAERGVGAIATQAETDTSYGRLGLALLKAGKTAAQTLDGLVAADPGRDLRQVAVVDAQNRVAVHTGKRCVETAGHLTGAGFSVQGNMLANDAVLEKMVQGYEKARGDFNEKLLQALEEGQIAGGDVRGKQSAALLVARGPEEIERDWVTDLRVDDADHPLVELRRLLTIQRGQEWELQAVRALEKGDLDKAHEYYGNLRGLVVGSRQPLFWYAVALVENDRIDEALPIFGLVFAVEPVWRDLIDRLAKAGYFPDRPDVIKQVKAV